MTVVVEIDVAGWTDITAYIPFHGDPSQGIVPFQLEKVRESNIGVLRFGMDSSAVNPPPGTEIRVKVDGIVRFAGYITTREQSRHGAATTMLTSNYDCQDYNSILDRIVVPSYDIDAGDTDSTEIETLRATYLAGVGVTAGTISTIDASMEALHLSGTFRQCMEAICGVVGGATFYITASKTLNYGTQAWSVTGSENLSDDLTVVDSHPYTNFVLRDDETRRINAVYIIGEGIEGWYPDPPGANYYQAIITDPSITTQTALDNLGAAIVNDFGTPLEEQSLTCWNTDVWEYDEVTVRHSDLIVGAPSLWTRRSVARALTVDGTELVFDLEFGDHTIESGYLGPAPGTGGGGMVEHILLSSPYHTDTDEYTVTRGALIVGDSTPEWNGLAHPAAAGYALTTDATDTAWDQTPTWTGRHTWNDGSDRAYIDEDGSAWFTGAVTIGVNDTTTGQIQLYGQGTGSDEGGEFVLFTAADHDAVIDYYILDVNQDDVRLFPSTAAWVDKFTAEGQLQLPATGSGAGVLIGGDAQWYRSAANVMATPDDLYLAGAGLGIIHVDGVAAGQVLVANGTRYVPGDITDIGAAPDDAQYVVMALDGDLSAERVLTAGDGIALTDGGANGNATLAVDLVAAWSGLEFSGGDLRIDLDATFNAWTGAHTFSNDVNLAEYLIHSGDADTYIRFQDDNITLRAGGTDLLDLVEAGTDYVLFGARADLNGHNIILDADGDTYWALGVDDTATMYVNSVSRYSFTSNNLILYNSVGTDILQIRTHGDVTNTGADIWADSQLGLAADENVHIFIDANANESAAYFSVRHDAEDWTASSELFRVQENGQVGIMLTTPVGKLGIDQQSATGAIPVLYMRQQDVDQEFMRFRGSAAAATLDRSIVDYGDEGSSTAAAWVKVYISDDGNQVTDQAYFLLAYTLSA